MRSTDALGRTLPLVVLTLLIAGAGWQVAAGPGGEEQLARGQRLYRIYCVNCHGEDGRGEGPMTPLLVNQVPDLTRLAQTHGGEFPRSHVYQSIDGRYKVPTHGEGEMPVWGLSFRVLERDSDREEEVEERLHDLVAYLESMQVGAEE